MLRHSVVFDSLRPRGLQPTRLLCPWDFPGKNTEVGRHSLLQEIFLTQESDLRLLYLLHCKQTLSHWAAGKPCILAWCCCSVTQLCLTLCDPMDRSTPGLPVLPCLLKLMSVESVRPSNYWGSV